MIKTLASLFILILAAESQDSSPDNNLALPASPCPGIFSYDSIDKERSRWHGTIKIITETAVRSLYLNILLDSKADLLGNSLVEVYTKNNMEYKLASNTFQIEPPMKIIRFFVKYNSLKKPPKLQRITFNGQEICDADIPAPAIKVPLATTKVTKSPPEYTKKTEQTISIVRTVETTSVMYPENEEEVPAYDPTESQPCGANCYDDYPLPYTSVPAPQLYFKLRTEKQVSNVHQATTFATPRQDLYENRTVNRNRSSSNQIQCGKVATNFTPLVLGEPIQKGEWPWNIALYRTESLNNKYLCGGTLVSNLHVITAAHCVTILGTRTEVDKDTLTVYLGKHNLKTTVRGVRLRYVDEIIISPEYDETTLLGNVAILKLHEPVTFSDTVRPACLWPEHLIDLDNVIGNLGSVVGWGLDYTGALTEDLFLLEMPVVSQETCLSSYDVFLRHTSYKTYCAGHRDGTSPCNANSGGGMMFNMQDTWYLRGLVSISVRQKNQQGCDPSHYVVFTDLAKFLPWIERNM